MPHHTTSCSLLPTLHVTTCYKLMYSTSFISFSHRHTVKYLLPVILPAHRKAQASGMSKVLDQDKWHRAGVRLFLKISYALVDKN